MVTKIPAPQYQEEAALLASSEQREKAKMAAINLIDGFAWEKTAEGKDFWDGVYERLKAISRGEPLK
jgi:hypothetical protein